jgi:hypothetical protein
MQTLVLALLLAAVLALFLPAAQNRVRGALHARPSVIWAVPLLLVAIFSGAATLAHLLHHGGGSCPFPMGCSFENRLVTRFLSA